MNKERLQNVIRAIREGREEDFRMSVFSNSCGTPACALGHYAARDDLQEQFALGKFSIYIAGGSTEYPLDLFDRTAEHFDITLEEITELFSVTGCGGGYLPDDTFIRITAKEAMTYIENFIARHEVVREEVEEAIEEVTTAREPQLT